MYVGLIKLQFSISFFKHTIHALTLSVHVQVGYCLFVSGWRTFALLKRHELKHDDYLRPLTLLLFEILPCSQENVRKMCLSSAH